MAGSPVIIAATAKHTATVIFLHGLGDTGPTMPVTLNGGFRMPSWFDLRTLDANGPEDEEGIKRATELVHGMIEQEVKAGIPSNRIVLGGFSQGGALALYSALKFPKPLAGVIALSCWLPLHKQFPAAAVANKDIPYIQCHGDCDPIVPYKWGQMTASLLKQFLRQIEFKTYRGMMHSSSDEEILDLKAFLEKVIPPQ
ncbi:acyl-protein thioesterase 1 isoform X2 [Schistocerca nitens]|uniref:acyl-protein thioesterase 1 isoform X2 n=1 Tax=Schistocerca nitens TaxID=7011 RepID=UPI00211993DC|nr:acyl-protein thioesterase 1 isoform X2 [Schistocerca nitens]